ncbi:hypothetical protein [Azospirillum soli]|uniref:Bbp19 family protein n=1 Tax=Azospirillum soli TaxID=1304799 RepID=UPI001AE568AA|nr:hypothetical protein [Azospirillum soli]MBP2313380.1 hypothetical protein [Azospirillum soli]
MAEPAGWDWLDGVAPASKEDGPAPSDPALSFGRCFAGADGARVLGVLKAMTLERTLAPDAPEPALRHLEGQRALVALILALVARGQAN